jgi:GDSL-like Lipase/Acylhydrolase family
MARAKAAGWLGRSLRLHGVTKAQWKGLIVSGLRMTSATCSGPSPLATAVTKYVGVPHASGIRAAVIALGANDIMRDEDGTTAADCVSDTFESVSVRLENAGLAHHVLVVLPLVRPSAYADPEVGRQVRLAIEYVARKHRFFVVDLERLMEPCRAASFKAIDGLHPNERGYVCASRQIAGDFTFSEFARLLR